MTPYETPAGASGPPWATETYQEQQGYADAFDGGQEQAGQYGYADAGGYREPQGVAGYPAQDHYAAQNGYGAQDSYGGPFAGYGGAQNAGYGDQGGYGSQAGGYADQGGYADIAGGYADLTGGLNDGGAGFGDPRSSGPLLSAPDQTSWDGLAGNEPAVAAGEVKPPGILAGAVMGIVGGGFAIGIATLVAAFFRPQASPINAVGEWFIDHTPQWLKEFAIQKFGERDKDMLLLGMYVTIALLAIVIGVLARRRPIIGIIGVAALGLFGAYIAYTRPASKFSDVIPSIIGGIAGVGAFLLLVQSAAAPGPERRIRHGNARTATNAGTAGSW